jgi:flagellar biosynthetic protein FliO
MTTTARLLTILALSLPLAACAAQPAPATQAPAAQAAKSGQEVQAGGAAVTAAPASAPAAAPQTGADPAARPHAADNARATVQSATSAAQPRRSVGAAGASTIATPATNTPPETAPAAEPSTVPAPAANAPAMNPASPAAPETTVGGGAANRPAPPYTDGARAGMPAPMPATSATGSLLQTLLALIVVLGVLGALAWFLKRYGPKAGGGSANLRVVGALNLGGRERVLVVEVGNQWIVVGASPGRINALATMPKQEGMDTGAGGTHATLAPHTQPANSFADWLKQTIDKRK